MAVADDEIEFVEVNGTRKKFADTTARAAVDSLGETVEDVEKKVTFNNVNNVNITNQCTRIDSKYENVTVVGTKYNGWAYVRVSVNGFSQEATPVNYDILKLPKDWECAGFGEWIATPGLYYNNDTIVGIAGRIQITPNGILKMQESNKVDNVQLRLMFTYPVVNS